MKKILVILLAVIIVTSLTSCVFVPLDSNQQTLNGSNDSANQPVPSAVSEKAMEIYFLNFKPEIAEVYQRIATDYESETGVKVNVVTAASGTYETTLKSEIAKAEAPTIFQINGPVGYRHGRNTVPIYQEPSYTNIYPTKSCGKQRKRCLWHSLCCRGVWDHL